MKISLYFVRHGQTNWNNLGQIQGRTNISLNEIGLYQAHLNSYKLNNLTFDKIYSSPLIRAYETASIYKKNTSQHATILTNNLLIERCFGELEGQKFNINNFTQDDSHFLRNYSGFETNLDLQKRLQKFFDYLLSQSENNNKNILCVSHSHVIKAVLSLSQSNHGYHSEINNCGVVILTLNKKGLFVEKFNV